MTSVRKLHRQTSPILSRCPFRRPSWVGPCLDSYGPTLSPSPILRLIFAHPFRGVKGGPSGAPGLAAVTCGVLPNASFGKRDEKICSRPIGYFVHPVLPPYWGKGKLVAHGPIDDRWPSWLGIRRKNHRAVNEQPRRGLSVDSGELDSPAPWAIVVVTHSGWLGR